MINIYNLKIKDLDLEINLIIKRNNKKIYIRAYKPNIIKITTPLNLSKSKVEEYLKNNYDFIKKVLNKETLPLNSNEIHFLGRPYKLVTIQDKKNKVDINQDTIYIYAKSLDEITIKSLIHKFYKSELKKIVESNINTIKKEFNITFDIVFEYKNAKTYFGECFSRRKKVILATRLAKYEYVYIISVIYHELAHFYHQNHGAEYYKLLESVFPNYKEVQKSLRRIKFRDIY
ncbi:MAG: DUF45 domain-containing protein [Acholeplasmatales bacterium]|nr:DUF45 domain-containing protein [Acholeplasmatales bacterium]